jgi:hypothetical protein
MTRLSGPLSLVAGCVVLAGLAATGCGSAPDDDPNAPYLVTFSETYLTIRNQSASALTEGQIELVPSGVLAPFRARLPRIETGADRDVPFDMFAGTGGARFRRGTMRIRSVRVTATDVVGTTHKREVPFQ